MTDRSAMTDRELADEINQCRSFIRPIQHQLDAANREWVRRHTVPCETECLEPMAGVTIR